MTEPMTYHKEGDYYIPDVQPDPMTNELRKWGRKYLDYMKKSHSIKMQSMMVFGQLLPTAIEKQKMAEETEERMIKELKEQDQVTNGLRNENPIEWQKKMYQIEQEIERVIMDEIICL